MIVFVARYLPGKKMIRQDIAEKQTGCPALPTFLAGRQTPCDLYT
jgi:hypothetical protein